MDGWDVIDDAAASEAINTPARIDFLACLPASLESDLSHYSSGLNQARPTTNHLPLSGTHLLLCSGLLDGRHRLATNWPPHLYRLSAN